MAKKAAAKKRRATKPGHPAQFGALCYRFKGGKLRILLITSRGRGRWIVPKGWPMRGRRPERVAAREAWEEAGVRGTSAKHCLGTYNSAKLLKGGELLPVTVMVYPVRVATLKSDFPERKQRRRKWFSPKNAAAKVSDPELAKLLRNFDPRKLP